MPFVPSKVFLRAVLLHYFNMKQNAFEAYSILVEVYGVECTPTQVMCQRWFARFTKGNYDLEDEEPENEEASNNVDPASLPQLSQEPAIETIEREQPLTASQDCNDDSQSEQNDIERFYANLEKLYPNGFAMDDDDNENSDSDNSSVCCITTPPKSNCKDGNAESSIIIPSDTEIKVEEECDSEFIYTGDIVKIKNEPEIDCTTTAAEDVVNVNTNFNDISKPSISVGEFIVKDEYETDICSDDEFFEEPQTEIMNRFHYSLLCDENIETDDEDYSDSEFSDSGVRSNGSSKPKDKKEVNKNSNKNSNTFKNVESKFKNIQIRIIDPSRENMDIEDEDYSDSEFCNSGYNSNASSKRKEKEEVCKSFNRSIHNCNNGNTESSCENVQNRIVGLIHETMEIDDEDYSDSEFSDSCDNSNVSLKPNDKEEDYSSSNNNNINLCNSGNAETNDQHVQNLLFGPSPYPANENIPKDIFLQIHFMIKCEICQIQFDTFNLLSCHFRKEHAEQPYVVCCNKKIFHRRVLVEHVKCHLNPEDFKCNICAKTFSGYNRMKAHKRRVHGGEEFACDQCDKKLKSRYNLDVHKLSHMAEMERRFQCYICDRKYGSPLLLRQHHRNSHLAKTWKRQGKSRCKKKSVKIDKECKKCSLKFRTNTDLVTHITEIHKRESLRNTCVICEKKFKKKSFFVLHMSNHISSVHCCPWCKKEFNSSYNLNIHQKKEHPREWKEEHQKTITAENIVGIEGALEE
ncbi:uncharacterized protein [Musca autumnalis]|uniref:uncharacterized protein n=1 Tax=Musca autumnalis TaxID=221902 RepID=UPI003CF37197